jgi:glycerol-1-phosphate dehydrogenase [NAD(P)+]
LHSIWPDLQTRLEATLPPLSQLQAQLTAAGAPADAASIGIDPQRLAADVRRARLIRRRFTVLDLLADLGWLDRAIAAVLPTGEHPVADSAA